MNLFRLCGDMLHVASILLLLLKLIRKRSCAGISCRMQEMYLTVFVSRYLDLLFSFVSLYNTLMKVFFIASTGYLIFLMRKKPPVSATYERSKDSFPHEKLLLLPCLLLGFLFSEDYYSPTEILWSSSIWLEAVAIVPQLIMLQQQREVENLTSDFVFCMGAYRGMYILNWVYRYFVEGYVNYIGWTGGLIQTALYADFFYYYAKSRWYGSRLVLPMQA